MATFNDTTGRTWTLSIDALLIEQVRDDCDPAFLKGDPTETFQRLYEDPALLCTTIWILCREQAAAAGIEQKQFFREVVGDSIDAATDALTKAMVSFIPRRHRELLEVSAAKNDKLQELVTRKGLAALGDPTLDEKVEAALDAAISKVMTQLESAGSAPVSSASTPAD